MRVGEEEENLNAGTKTLFNRGVNGSSPHNDITVSQHCTINKIDPYGPESHRKR